MEPGLYAEAVIRRLIHIGIIAVSLSVLPPALFGALPTSAVYNVSASISSVDWSPGDNLVALALDGTEPEIVQILRITNNVVTLTNQVNFGTGEANAVRWHHSLHYLAVGKDSDANKELYVYQVNPTTAKFTTTNSIEVGADVNALAWNPRNNQLAVGTANGTSELRIYNFTHPNLTTILVHDIMSSPRIVQPNALAWHPNGSNLVVGLDSSTTPPFIHYQYNGSTLSAGDGLTPWEFAGLYAGSAVGWSRSGDLLALGGTPVASGTNLIRIYRFNPTNSSLVSITGAVDAVTLNVTSLQWSPIGDLLIAGLGTLASTQTRFRVYRFVRDEERLELLDENYISPLSTTEVLDLRWSRNSRYVAVGLDVDEPFNKLKILRYELADLKITKTSAPLLAQIGSNINYTITVQNLGPDPAVSVTVTDTLPASVEFVSASVSTNNYWLSNQVFSIQNIGTLNSGASTSFSLVVTVLSNTTGTITNKAEVSAFTTDPLLTNNIAFATNYFDLDLDGFGDPVDNCPTNFNPGQENSDGDPFGNACDNCPTVTNTNQFDVDFDGWGDVCDNCPTNFNPLQENFDGDAFGVYCDNCPTVFNPGQADADLDAVGDACDNCPTNFNPAFLVVEGTNVIYFQDDLDGDGLGDVCDPDIDGDLLPNTWEATYGFDFNSPNSNVWETYLDDDGDGYVNIEEYIADTHPLNSNSYPRITAFHQENPLVISWPGVTGRLYDVLAKSNVYDSQWTVVKTGLPGTGSLFSVTDTNTVWWQRYYWFRVKLAP